jgi:glutamine amidotransferase
MQRSGVDEPLRLSLAVTDGQEVWAFRFSSDGHSPTLFYGTPQTRGESTDADMIHTIASEPSDSQAHHWHAVSESSGVHWKSGRITAFSLQL